MTDNPCIFCLDEQRNPLHIPCGHSFCAECFQHYLHVGLDSRCPLCRLDFRGYSSADNPREFSNNQQNLARNELIGLNDMYNNFAPQNDILMLTLSEQECRLFDELYQEVLQRFSPDDDYP